MVHMGPLWLFVLLLAHHRVSVQVSRETTARRVLPFFFLFLLSLLCLIGPASLLGAHSRLCVLLQTGLCSRYFWRACAFASSDVGQVKCTVKVTSLRLLFFTLPKSARTIFRKKSIFHTLIAVGI